MSVREPKASCYDLGFHDGYPIDEAAEVALEDYARALTRAPAAEAVRQTDDPALVRGVHICGLGISLTQALLDDLESFARALTPPRSSGLGWN